MRTTAIRWGGLLLMIGAALLGTAIVIASLAPDMSQQLPLLANVLLFSAAVLLLQSLPAMYAGQASAAGWHGLMGHALLQTGVLLFVVVTAPPLLYASFNRPFENSLTAFLLGIALTLGLLLTTVAIIRAGVYPRWAGILLLIGTGGIFFGFFIAEWLPRPAGQMIGVITEIPLGLALMWVGYSMWRGL